MLRGGESIGPFEVAYTPGHASHHVSYRHEPTATAFVGDVAGVRIPPSGYILPPTPPPDIDVEPWQESIERVRAWAPARLAITHFGLFDDVDEHLDGIAACPRDARRSALATWTSRSTSRVTAAEIAAAGDPETVACYRARRAARSDLRRPRALLVQARSAAVTQTVERSRVDGPGTGHGGRWNVIVRNDDHNTFDHVAATLARVIPGVTLDRGYAFADRIHNTGLAIVWSGHRELAELYWEQLRAARLTMAPLERA